MDDPRLQPELPQRSHLSMQKEEKDMRGGGGGGNSNILTNILIRFVSISVISALTGPEKISSPALKCINTTYPVMDN